MHADEACQFVVRTRFVFKQVRDSQGRRCMNGLRNLVAVCQTHEFDGRVNRCHSWFPSGFRMNREICPALEQLLQHGRCRGSVVTTDCTAWVLDPCGSDHLLSHHVGL